MELYEILTARRKEKGMSLIELSQISGVPKGSVDKIMSGASKNPGITPLIAITHALGLTLEDLDDNKKAPEAIRPDALRIASDYERLDSYGQRAVRAILDVELARMEEVQPAPTPFVTLRRYNEPAAAGAPLWAEDGFDFIDVPADTVPDGADYTVGISGHSMEPDYPNGCTVFVKQSTHAHDGDVVIAWLEGDGTVCKRVVAPLGHVERLESINRDYPDFSGSRLEGMRIYGIVLGYMR